jgi:hypothetical protein
MAVTITQIQAILDQVALGVAALQAMIASLKNQVGGVTQADLDALAAKATTILNATVINGAPVPIPGPGGIDPNA